MWQWRSACSEILRAGKRAEARHRKLMVVDEEPLVELITELARYASGDDLPVTLRNRARIGLERMEDLLAAVRSGNKLLADEIVHGTFAKEGRRRSDGLPSILPSWARGHVVLDALVGVVVVDETLTPVTVTVHWERVPPGLRRAAASLASELVDAYRPRPKGGRPRKNSPADSPSKPGDPDTSGTPD